MREQHKSESRVEYLVRVLHDFMHNTSAGQEEVDYDGARCDGFCLAEDIANELNIDV